MPQSAELRELLDSGELIGPRLVIMGPTFSAPGGHPGVTVCRNNARCRAGLREVGDEDQARAYVRERSNRGIHTLKVIANFIPDVNIGRRRRAFRILFSPRSPTKHKRPGCALSQTPPVGGTCPRTSVLRESLIGPVLVGFGVRQHGRPEAISKRASSSASARVSRSSASYGEMSVG
jgi:hypothetical protein